MARFLPATIESLCSQSFSNWECILVDDGSRDDTLSLIESYAEKDPRFRAFHQDNAGRAIALRTGCSLVSESSEFFYFLDSDDLLHPKTLELSMAYMDQHPAVGIVASHSQLINEQGIPIPGLTRSRWAKGFFFPRQLKPTEALTPFESFFCATGQGPFALHRRSFFSKTQGFDPRFSEFSLHEDTDIFAQMALVSEVHYLPDKLYYTRKHQNNTSRGDNPKIQLAYARFREKWDNYQGADGAQNQLLANAKSFYRHRFRPLRNFKVALIVAKDGLQRRKGERFLHALSLCWDGVLRLAWLRSR